MKPFRISKLGLAEIIHDATRRIPRIDGSSVPEWNNLHRSERSRALAAVTKLLNDPVQSNEAAHNIWCEYKRSGGWVYGGSHSESELTHPSLVAYELLPDHDKLKDSLWVTLIELFRPFVQ